MLRFLMIFAAAISVLVVGGFAYVYNDRADLAAYEDLFVDEGPAPAGTVSVKMLGISTMLISDGHINLMIDGFFTKPGLIEIMSKIWPDEARIDAALASLGNPRINMITAVHSHYDHAMDTPIVAMKTGALMIGSSSTLNIGRGLGLAEDRMIEAGFDVPYKFGKFTITFLPSNHVPLPQENMYGPITEPLTQPRRLNAWKQGEAYSILIAHESGKTMLVQGSAGWEAGALLGRKVDVVLLGAGGLGGQPRQYKQTYWDEMVVATDPALVVPIHWDDLFASFGTPLRSNPSVIDDFDATMAFVNERAKEEGRAVALMQFGATLWLD